MFNFISNIIRIMFLIVWIPISIVYAPIIIIIGMAMKEDWAIIKEVITSIMFLKIT